MCCGWPNTLQVYWIIHLDVLWMAQYSTGILGTVVHLDVLSMVQHSTGILGTVVCLDVFHDGQTLYTGILGSPL